jgi:hypothetical protein
MESSQPAGRWFWSRLVAGVRSAERGQATLEYIGALVASSVVVALVIGAVVLPGPRGAVISGLKRAVCAVTGGPNCGSGQPGSGQSGSGQPGTDQPGTDQPGTDQPGAGQPGAGQPGTDQSGSDPGSQAPKDEGCHGFLGCAWSGAKQVGSGVYNVGKGAVDDVVGIVDLVKDPSQLIDAGKYIIDHPGEAALSLVWDQESQDMWDQGDYGGAVGRTIWNVGSWFIPGVDVGRAVSKLGKFAKLAKIAEDAAKLAKLGKLADEAGTLAKAAEEAAAHGDAGAAHRAAEAAQKKADDAQAEAKVQSCPIAAGLLPRQRLEAVPGTVLALSVGGGGAGRFGAAAPVTLVPLAHDGGCADAKRAQQEADRAKAAFVKQFETGPDEAYFWSGRTDGVGGADRSAELARVNGGKTLEMLMAERGIKMPPWDPADPSSLTAWDDVSQALAQGAKGTVHAVVGQVTRPGSVWERVELPALKNNPNVTKIVAVDPKTGIETVLWER